MALSNSQYDQLMRDYEQLQLDNEHELRLRFDEVYAKIPKLRTIDDTISSLSVEKAKRLLEGDEDALSSFHEKLLTLTGEKQKLLTSHGFPSDYLEKHYHCPDCQDTGYIGTRKCHCMKKAIIELLYNDSNLKGILEQENFHTFSLDYYSKSHIDPLTGRSARDCLCIAGIGVYDGAAVIPVDAHRLEILGGDDAQGHRIDAAVYKPPIRSHTIAVLAARATADCRIMREAAVSAGHLDGLAQLIPDGLKFFDQLRIDHLAAASAGTLEVLAGEVLAQGRCVAGLIDNDSHDCAS